MTKSLKLLKQQALAESRRLYPNFPEAARYVRPYSDKTANNLTRCIIEFLRFNSHQAERINSTGRYIDSSRIVTDVIGSRRQIGSGKWIPTSGQRGTADISATIRGQSVKIEVKIKDRQSDAQKVYQTSVEQAGGLYWLVHSFDEFKSLYNDMGAKAGIPGRVP